MTHDAIVMMMSDIGVLEAYQSTRWSARENRQPRQTGIAPIGPPVRVFPSTRCSVPKCAKSYRERSNPALSLSRNGTVLESRAPPGSPQAKGHVIVENGPSGPHNAHFAVEEETGRLSRPRPVTIPRSAPGV